MCFLYQKVQDFAYKAKNGTKDTVFHVKSTKKTKSSLILKNKSIFSYFCPNY